MASHSTTAMLASAPRDLVCLCSGYAAAPVCSTAPNPMALKAGQPVNGRSGESRMNKIMRMIVCDYGGCVVHMSLVSIVSAVDGRLQMWFNICVQHHLQQPCLFLTSKAVYSFASVPVYIDQRQRYLVINISSYS